MTTRILICFFEFTELGVAQSIFDMVCQRQIIKCILLSCLVIYFHIIVDHLLVGQVEIVLLVVCGTVAMTSGVFLFGQVRFWLRVKPSTRCNPRTKWFQ
jgi:hypothetical protein